MIQQLIDKVDNQEVIRDQIAAILYSESVSQQALALTAGKDADDWKLRIYTERSNPFEQWLEINESTDFSPLVNVWFEATNYNATQSNVMERQKAETIYNIDIYGYGQSSDVVGGGHKAGDQESAEEVQRSLRIVRNILMAGEYTYLGLQGLVWGRWPQSVTAFQPQLDGRTIQQIQAVRMSFKVDYNEFSPQYIPETLDYMAIDVTRNEDGSIYTNVDFDYTL